jgi:FixJ family two-component response regulator
MTSWGRNSLDVAEVSRSPHSLKSESCTRDVTRRDGSGAFVALVERAWGCRTQPFTSAEEFLGQLNSNVFSCLVLDVRLKGMNGLELQGQLFRSHLKVPIVFVTAVDLEEVKAAALQAGAIAYLPKPVNEGDLLKAVYSAAGE